MHLLWRLTELAEIPLAGIHKRVQNWLAELYRATVTEAGFSLTGEVDELVSCYNAMIASIVLRLRQTADRSKPAATGHLVQGLDAAIDWILQYQLMERGRNCEWPGRGVQRYGGCLKTTPCYVGVVKSVRALSDYMVYDSRRTPEVRRRKKRVREKLQSGLEYILAHQIYQRASDSTPITPYIVQCTYPASYRTNIIEILEIMRVNELLDDGRCQAAREYLRQARGKDGYWRNQSDPAHRDPAWVRFDPPRKPGMFISAVVAPLIGVELQESFR